MLIFADSHGRNAGMFYAMEREQPDCAVHLGDHTEDADELDRAYHNKPIYRVRGNNDYGSDAPYSAVITPENVPIYLTHGHKERVSMYSCGIVPQKAAENGCVFAFYGHTHRMLLEKYGGVWVCNPGSISLPRGGPASYARLTIENGMPISLTLLEEDGGLIREERFGH
ncbi:metallophosphoesterase [Agathobaculum sp. NTUH-O15-33]|uniref:metallophosphoesterase family protein n=1 Tax=Agathobaculum sp. NTUH-O15-33 TaxID=3079302 RepID=UPI0029589560|nr:metallophosphoesterase [Agathobaculum sp. NTUH-O15-33]WNX86647.1 metallophosphoesterase [Agathobaculum sp. NTUH-O15-33]